MSGKIEEYEDEFGMIRNPNYVFNTDYDYKSQAFIRKRQNQTRRINLGGRKSRKNRRSRKVRKVRKSKRQTHRRS